MGFKIREARTAQKLTQKDLADKAGVSRTIISGLESGRIINTTAGTLQKIASALNLTLSDIFFAA